MEKYIKDMTKVEVGSSNLSRLIDITNSLTNPFAERDSLLYIIRKFPYPIWIKKMCITEAGVEFRMMWISEEYERNFNIKLEDYQSKLDKDIWPKDIACSFKKNDLETIKVGKVITKEFITNSVGKDETEGSEWFVIKYVLGSIEEGSDSVFILGFSIPIKDIECALFDNFCNSTPGENPQND